MRTRYIQNPKTLKLELADEYQRDPEPMSAMIIGDISPYRSMATGEVIQGRRQHREHLREHRLIEVGNERQKTVQREPDRASIRQSLADSVQRFIR